MNQPLVSIKNELYTTWQGPAHYRLVIPVGEVAAQAIGALQASFINKNDVRHPAEKLELVVGTFSANAMQVSTMVRWMLRFFHQTNAISLCMNNFSGVPPHLLYMRIHSTEELLHMRLQIDKLNQYLQGYDLPVIEQHARWAVTLFKNLPGMLYDKALQFFARQELAIALPVTELLLQKYAANDAHWKLAHRIQLQTPVSSFTEPWYAPSHLAKKA